MKKRRLVIFNNPEESRKYYKEFGNDSQWLEKRVELALRYGIMKSFEDNNEIEEFKNQYDCKVI